MNLIVPLMMLFLAKSSTVKPRKPVKGKSGRTWFVVDSTVGASRVPVRDVFAAATGNELVITFAVLSGGVRARIFVSPSSLSAVALSDFDVSTMQAGKLK